MKSKKKSLYHNKRKMVEISMMCVSVYFQVVHYYYYNYYLCRRYVLDFEKETPKVANFMSNMIYTMLN